MLEAIAKNGGVVQVLGLATVADLVNQIDHAVRVAGIDLWGSAATSTAAAAESRGGRMRPRLSTSRASSWNADIAKRKLESSGVERPSRHR